MSNHTLMALLIPAWIFLLASQTIVGEIRAPAIDISSMIEDEFAAYAPNYRKAKARYTAQMEALGEHLVALQEQGYRMACSEQIFVESRWLIQHTASWSEVEDRLSRLKASLKSTDQSDAEHQSPADGAWGLCYTYWFMKLDATIDELNSLARTKAPIQYPLLFLNRMADSTQFVSYLNSLVLSDIRRTGIDQRDELNSVVAAVSQIVFKPQIRQYLAQQANAFRVPDETAEAFLFFLNSIQDPETGYWGAWYRIHGNVIRSVDLSITFHVVSYRRGNVNHWPRLIDTTLAIRNSPYPFGWLHRGQYTHHNNYAVVQLLKYGWSTMSEAQRYSARREIERMLDWCFTQTSDSERIFSIDPSFYSSPANYFYYGVRFLAEIGYWNESERFWTDKAFPDSRNVCRSIRQKLESMKLGAQPATSAMVILKSNCP